MAKRRKRRSRSPQTKTASGDISHGIGRRQVFTVVGGGAILGGILIGLSVVNGRKDTAPNEDLALSSKPVAEIAKASNLGQPSSNRSKSPRTLLSHEKGNPDALVTVIDFSSYTCPHCRDFTLNTEPIIDKLYVSTGQILFSFRHSPLDDLASRAGEAVEAAGTLGDFWGYHHQLMERQTLLVQERYSDSSLTAIASDIGLDSNQFTTELKSGKYRDKIQADVAESKRRQVRAVPTIFINQEQIQGNQKQLILDTIDLELTKVSNAG